MVDAWSKNPEDDRLEGCHVEASEASVSNERALILLIVVVDAFCFLVPAKLSRKQGVDNVFRIEGK
jgi:hypothetical protein